MAPGGWAALLLLDVRVFAWTSRWRDDLLLMTRLRVWDCRVNAPISDRRGRDHALMCGWGAVRCFFIAAGLSLMRYGCFSICGHALE